MHTEWTQSWQSQLTQVIEKMSSEDCEIRNAAFRLMIELYSSQHFAAAVNRGAANASDGVRQALLLLILARYHAGIDKALCVFLHEKITDIDTQKPINMQNPTLRRAIADAIKCDRGTGMHCLDQCHSSDVPRQVIDTELENLVESMVADPDSEIQNTAIRNVNAGYYTKNIYFRKALLGAFKHGEKRTQALAASKMMAALEKHSSYRGPQEERVIHDIANDADFINVVMDVMLHAATPFAKPDTTDEAVAACSIYGEGYHKLISRFLAISTIFETEHVHKLAQRLVSAFASKEVNTQKTAHAVLAEFLQGQHACDRSTVKSRQLLVEAGLTTKIISQLSSDDLGLKCALAKMLADLYRFDCPFDETLQAECLTLISDTVQGCYSKTKTMDALVSREKSLQELIAASRKRVDSAYRSKYWRQYEEEKAALNQLQRKLERLQQKKSQVDTYARVKDHLLRFLGYIALRDQSVSTQLFDLGLFKHMLALIQSGQYGSKELDFLEILIRMHPLSCKDLLQSGCVGVIFDRIKKDQSSSYYRGYSYSALIGSGVLLFAELFSNDEHYPVAKQMGVMDLLSSLSSWTDRHRKAHKYEIATFALKKIAASISALGGSVQATLAYLSYPYYSESVTQWVNVDSHVRQMLYQKLYDKIVSEAKCPVVGIDILDLAPLCRVTYQKSRYEAIVGSYDQYNRKQFMPLFVSYMSCTILDPRVNVFHLRWQLKILSVVLPLCDLTYLWSAETHVTLLCELKKCLSVADLEVQRYAVQAIVTMVVIDPSYSFSRDDELNHLLQPFLSHEDAVTRSHVIRFYRAAEYGKNLALMVAQLDYQYDDVHQYVFEYLLGVASNDKLIDSVEKVLSIDRLLALLASENTKIHRHVTAMLKLYFASESLCFEKDVRQKVAPILIRQIDKFDAFTQCEMIHVISKLTAIERESSIDLDLEPVYSLLKALIHHRDSTTRSQAANALCVFVCEQAIRQTALATSDVLEPQFTALLSEDEKFRQPARAVIAAMIQGHEANTALVEERLKTLLASILTSLRSDHDVERETASKHLYYIASINEPCITLVLTSEAIPQCFKLIHERNVSIANFAAKTLSLVSRKGEKSHQLFVDCDALSTYCALLENTDMSCRISIIEAITAYYKFHTDREVSPLDRTLVDKLISLQIDVNTDLRESVRVALDTMSAVGLDFSSLIEQHRRTMIDAYMTNLEFTNEEVNKNALRALGFLVHLNPTNREITSSLNLIPALLQYEHRMGLALKLLKNLVDGSTRQREILLETRAMTSLNKILPAKDEQVYSDVRDLFVSLLDTSHYQQAVRRIGGFHQLLFALDSDSTARRKDGLLVLKQLLLHRQIQSLIKAIDFKLYETDPSELHEIYRNITQLITMRFVPSLSHISAVDLTSILMKCLADSDEEVQYESVKVFGLLLGYVDYQLDPKSSYYRQSRIYVESFRQAGVFQLLESMLLTGTTPLERLILRTLYTNDCLPVGEQNTYTASEGLLDRKKFFTLILNAGLAKSMIVSTSQQSCWYFRPDKSDLPMLDNVAGFRAVGEDLKHTTLRLYSTASVWLSPEITQNSGYSFKPLMQTIRSRLSLDEALSLLPAKSIEMNCYVLQLLHFYVRFGMVSDESEKKNAKILVTQKNINIFRSLLLHDSSKVRTEVLSLFGLLCQSLCETLPKLSSLVSFESSYMRSCTDPDRRLRLHAYQMLLFVLSSRLKSQSKSVLDHHSEMNANAGEIFLAMLQDTYRPIVGTAIVVLYTLTLDSGDDVKKLALSIFQQGGIIDLLLSMSTQVFTVESQTVAVQYLLSQIPSYSVDASAKIARAKAEAKAKLALEARKDDSVSTVAVSPPMPDKPSPAIVALIKQFKPQGYASIKKHASNPGPQSQHKTQGNRYSKSVAPKRQGQQTQRNKKHASSASRTGQHQSSVGPRHDRGKQSRQHSIQTKSQGHHKTRKGSQSQRSRHHKHTTHKPNSRHNKHMGHKGKRKTVAQKQVSSPMAASVALSDQSVSIPLSRFVIPAQSLHYDIATGLIGSGSFANVYRGQWRRTAVAIKLLLAQSIGSEAINELKEEGITMMLLRHPNIMTVYGICLDPGAVSLVMAYMSDGSLYQFIQNDSIALTWGDRLQIASGIAKGLSYLHDMRIMHRDLKSLNVLMSGCQPKITDFGLSKVRSDTLTMTSSSSGMVGTLAWMAPELMSDPDCVYTNACDMYSLGVILWEIAARKAPWAKATTASLIGMWVMSGKRESIPDDTPAEYASLISDCWAQEFAVRPDSSSVEDRLSALTCENVA